MPPQPTENEAIFDYKTGFSVIDCNGELRIELIEKWSLLDIKVIEISNMFVLVMLVSQQAQVA